jgi:hypothetical protein
MTKIVTWESYTGNEYPKSNNKKKKKTKEKPKSSSSYS